MKNLIQKLLALIGVDVRPSVDKALTSLKKVVADLEATAEHHGNLSAFHDRAIDVATTARAAADAEVAKAKTVVANVKALFGE